MLSWIGDLDQNPCPSGTCDMRLKLKVQKLFLISDKPEPYVVVTPTHRARKALMCRWISHFGMELGLSVPRRGWRSFVILSFSANGLRSAMTFLRTWSVKAGSLLLGLLLVSGCGGGGGDSSAGEPQTAPPPAGSTNTPPTISGQPGTSVLAGQAYSFQPSANDSNGDPLAFSVTNLPGWASFNTSTGRISGTPASSDVATYSGVTISVSDGTASAALTAFAITVTEVATGSASLSWLPPTLNSDGSALTNLAGYEVHYGRSANDLAQSVALSNPSLSTYVIENLTSGTWYFAVLAVNSGGVTSPLSNVASKTIG